MNVESSDAEIIYMGNIEGGLYRRDRQSSWIIVRRNGIYRGR